MTDLVDKFIEKYGRLPTEFDPDYLEMLRMSKYRILAVPDVSPGKCANCGSSKDDGRKYVDFGLHVDWYGAVFICGSCLHDIAHKVGLFASLEEQLYEALNKKASLDELQEQGEKLHDKVVKTVRELEDFYVGVYSHRTDNSPDSTSSVESESTPSTKSGSPSTESGTTKSTTVSGRKNVRSLAELLDTNGS